MSEKIQKYPHIDNGFFLDELDNLHYRAKFLDYWIGLYPQLSFFSRMVTYVLEEKIHGTNIQIAVDKDGNVKYGSRNHYLNGQNHMGLMDVMKEEIYQEFLDNLTRYCLYTSVPITLYGELFGGNINKGIHYGQKKKIRFFGMRRFGKFVSPQSFYDFMKEFGGYLLVVRRITQTTCLEHALNYDVDNLVSAYWDRKDENFKIAEGIVIKPLFATYLDNNDEPFYIKVKARQFWEKSRAKKPKVSQIKEESPLVPYINRNRVNSVYSKEGMIQSKKEISKYIKLVIEDAIADYDRDHDIPFKELDTKRFTNVGGMVAQLLIGDVK